MGLFSRFKGKQPLEDEPSASLDPVMTPEAVDLAHDVVDHLRLLHPHALGDIEVTGVIEQGQCKVHMVNVPGVGNDPVPNSLYVDGPLRNAFLSRSTGLMIAALGIDPGNFLSFSLTVRSEDVSLMGLQLPIEEERLKYGEAFMRHLLKVEPGIPERQESLRETMGSLGPARIAWDRDQGQLAFAPEGMPEVRISAEVLGSFAPDLQSWCWAWANASFDPAHVGAVAALREKPLAILRTEVFDCSEHFAYTVAHAAAGFMENKPVWRWPLPSGPQLFFVMSPG